MGTQLQAANRKNSGANILKVIHRKSGINAPPNIEAHVRPVFS
jgi:hypothetical protein